ncbi:ThiF family adenylyltransferase [Bacillus sp. YC2]|uniref:MoeB/ThiF family adenylyltransferase n=1 Tax=Bacillus sp. YC2 TaxID=2861287 RepID=UPI001CA6F2ED|nr:MoeB/ThiF family adenylyltransferase [Bacillus sp. YC2]MBY8912388.1 ThiF family adenylyltransferase [Bacillus sp. YC2]
MEERYSRQTRFKPIGEEGQKALADSSVLIVGAGALGTAGAEGLARAGIGRMAIIDRDYVEWSNLQRQQLYTEEDAKQRMPKAMAAKSRLLAVNSEIHIDAYVAEGTAETLQPLIEAADCVVDATDNFETRMLINDLAQKTKTPWIYGACVSSQGMYMTIIPGVTPCLSCLFEQIPVGGATCDTAGIIPPAVHIVSAYQQAEALKLLTGHVKTVNRRFVTLDVWNNSSMSINVDHIKRDHCPSCGLEPEYPYLQPENTPKASVLCGRDTVQIRSDALKRLPKQELVKRLKLIGKVEANEFLLHIAYERFRIVIFQDGRALIHGTNDITEANSVLARVIGL